MKQIRENRLTVIGGARDVNTFLRTRWYAAVGGEYYEPLELLPRRHVCQFVTAEDPLPELRRKVKPGVVLLLEYEDRRRRLKGLALVTAGRCERHEVRYRLRGGRR